MPAAKKKADPKLYIIHDVNYDDVRLVEGTLQDVGEDLKSLADDHEYDADVLTSDVEVFEVARRVEFTARQNGVEVDFS